MAPSARGFRFREDEALFAGFVVRTANGVAGFVDWCPHAGWPLGALDGRYLTASGEHILCFGHGAVFDHAGKCVAGPCRGQSLRRWPVAVRAGWVVTAEDR